jgi:hypothetical protein
MGGESWNEPSRDYAHSSKVLADEDPDRGEKLEKHLSAYPAESGLLLDSATSLGGKSRTLPALPKTFIPVGHIALDTEYETEKFRGDDLEGLYWISTFYISHALQNCGLGRAAMDVVENTATAEPLCAKTLALSTVAASELHSIRPKWEMMGIEPPKVGLYLEGVMKCIDPFRRCGRR